MFPGETWWLRSAYSGDEVGKGALTPGSAPFSEDMVQFLRDRLYEKAHYIEDGITFRNTLRETFVEMRKQWGETSFHPQGWMKRPPEDIAPDASTLTQVLEEDLQPHGFTLRRAEPLESLTDTFVAGPGAIPPVGRQRLEMKEGDIFPHITGGGKVEGSSLKYLQKIQLDYVGDDENGFPEYLLRLPEGEYLRTETGILQKWGGKDTFDRYEELKKQQAIKVEEDKRKSVERLKEYRRLPEIRGTGAMEGIEFLPEKSLSAPYVNRFIEKAKENYQRIP